MVSGQDGQIVNGVSGHTVSRVSGRRRKQRGRSSEEGYEMEGSYTKRKRRVGGGRKGGDESQSSQEGEDKPQGHGRKVKGQRGKRGRGRGVVKNNITNEDQQIPMTGEVRGQSVGTLGMSSASKSSSSVNVMGMSSDRTSSSSISPTPRLGKSDSSSSISPTPQLGETISGLSLVPTPEPHWDLTSKQLPAQQFEGVYDSEDPLGELKVNGKGQGPGASGKDQKAGKAEGVGVKQSLKSILSIKKAIVADENVGVVAESPVELESDDTSNVKTDSIEKKVGASVSKIDNSEEKVGVSVEKETGMSIDSSKEKKVGVSIDSGKEKKVGVSIDSGKDKKVGVSIDSGEVGVCAVEIDSEEKAVGVSVSKVSPQGKEVGDHTPQSCDTRQARQRVGSVSGILKHVSQFDTPSITRSGVSRRRVQFASQPHFREPKRTGQRTPLQGENWQNIC